MDDFLTALDTLSEACQLPTIKKLDKKREKYVPNDTTLIGLLDLA